MNEYHYQRSDKGIKRRNGKPTLPSPPADVGSWQIPADLDPQAVLDRYLTESTTSQIAQEFGLSRKALTRWLRQVKPKEWKEIQLIRSHCRLDDGEEGIERACDPLSLARAREQVKAAQFRLQALDDDYKQNQAVTAVIAPVFQVILKAVDNQVIQADIGVENKDLQLVDKSMLLPAKD